eukprot:3906486-Pleurochrysis_carterae.AAC.1
MKEQPVGAPQSTGEVPAPQSASGQLPVLPSTYGEDPALQPTVSDVPALHSTLGEAAAPPSTMGQIRALQPAVIPPRHSIFSSAKFLRCQRGSSQFLR